MISKECRLCKQWKPFGAFHKQKDSADGFRGECRLCKKGEKLKRDFGLTLDEYNMIWQRQGMVCAICGQFAEGKGKHVDHDHLTGKIRGILCSRCNQALGLMRDNPGIARKAMEYLENG